MMFEPDLEDPVFPSPFLSRPFVGTKITHLWGWEIEEVHRQHQTNGWCWGLGLKCQHPEMIF